MNEISMTARPRLADAVRLQWDSVRERHVLLAPEELLVLNATAAAVVLLCGEHNDVSTIIARLSKRYNAEVEQDVLHLLNRLLHKRMVVFDEYE